MSTSEVETCPRCHVEIELVGEPRSIACGSCGTRVVTRFGRPPPKPQPVEALASMHPSGTRGTPMRIVWLIVTVFVSVERAIAHVHDPEWRVFVVVTMCALGFIGGLVVLSDRKQQA